MNESTTQIDMCRERPARFVWYILTFGLITPYTLCQAAPLPTSQMKSRTSAAIIVNE